MAALFILRWDLINFRLARFITTGNIGQQKKPARAPSHCEKFIFLFICITKMKDAAACTIKTFLIPIMVQGLSVNPMTAASHNCRPTTDFRPSTLTIHQQKSLSVGGFDLSLLTTMKDTRPIFGQNGRIDTLKVKG
jgi:hypothetical protein